ncbi:MAG: type II toxin-antitoxin system VapC family toxin [Pseudomonadota bacterium]|nr:type II toxin-antitoxin system VapC family toxin [Pseudomonadota bacterium]
MILVDTSVWIDHLRRTEPALVDLLHSNAVAGHPFVLGELAMGSLRERAKVLASLAKLPQTAVAGNHEVLRVVEGHRLFGKGLGYIDAHLLAAVMLTPGTRLWTRDKTLMSAAIAAGLADPELG